MIQNNSLMVNFELKWSAANVCGPREKNFWILRMVRDLKKVWKTLLYMNQSVCRFGHLTIWHLPKSDPRKVFKRMNVREESHFV